MYYASIAALAAAILIIENQEILFDRPGSHGIAAVRPYRFFLIGVLVYYVTDFLWGILDGFHLTGLLFLDTVAYFAAMAMGVLLWTQYVVSYLGEENGYGRFLCGAGRAYFGAVAAAVLVNNFVPVLFRFDESGAYHACATRHVFLVVQIFLFMLTSIYAAHVMTKREGTARKRHWTICLFGMIMAFFLSIQFFNPLLPVYSVGYLLGVCLLHAFVVNDEKEDYKVRLEEACKREKEHYEELKSAWNLAYTDALTGVKSRLAFVEMEEQRDGLIEKDKADAFAVAVFDLNGLKEINDHRGHEVGDRFIVSASSLIRDHFQRSPVYRVGGDEFAVLLEGKAYLNRKILQKRFDRMIESFARRMKKEDQVVVAMGMSDYVEGKDGTFRQVFERADRQMYARKRELKERFP